MWAVRGIHEAPYYACMTEPLDLLRLAERVGRRLLTRGARVVAAESCTGGWIAKALTDVPGSSQWFAEGYVSYSNRAKQRDLKVTAETLRKHGAVSREVVKEMALGALARTGADFSVAVSGVAGPDGGTPAKPVGTVWICWAERRARGVRLRTRKHRFRGDRAAVRRRSVAEALRGLL
jgi:nicotinamide-nucleotide amidase